MSSQFIGPWWVKNGWGSRKGRSPILHAEKAFFILIVIPGLCLKLVFAKSVRWQMAFLLITWRPPQLCKIIWRGTVSKLKRIKSKKSKTGSQNLLQWRGMWSPKDYGVQGTEEALFIWRFSGANLAFLFLLGEELCKALFSVARVWMKEIGHRGNELSFVQNSKNFGKGANWKLNMFIFLDDGF